MMFAAILKWHSSGNKGAHHTSLAIFIRTKNLIL